LTLCYILITSGQEDSGCHPNRQNTNSDETIIDPYLLFFSLIYYNLNN